MSSLTSKRPKLHVNKEYTVWCENGHTAEEMVAEMLETVERIAETMSDGESKTIGMPTCPICSGALYEGAIN